MKILRKNLDTKTKLFSHDLTWVENQGIKLETVDQSFAVHFIKTLRKVFFRFAKISKQKKCDLNFLIMFKYLSPLNDRHNLLKGEYYADEGIQRLISEWNVAHN